MGIDTRHKPYWLHESINLPIKMKFVNFFIRKAVFYEYFHSAFESSAAKAFHIYSTIKKMHGIPRE